MSWPRGTERSTKIDALVELGRMPRTPYSGAELEAGLSLVTARLDAHRRRRGQLRRILPLASLVIVGSVAFAVASRWFFEPEPLAYEVKGGAVLDAGYLREINGSGVVVLFEEGTKVSLKPGARARLRSVDARGARVGLESGAASFEVTPDARRHWEVEVGPFLVQVKGTAFDVSWDPQMEQFHLDLERGTVLVSGPISGGELTLHGGQRLRVNLMDGETRISEARRTVDDSPYHTPVEAQDSAGSAAHATNPLPTHPIGLATDSLVGDVSTATGAKSIPGPAHAANSVTGAELSARPLGTPAHSQRDWAADLARGQWTKILRNAEEIGVQTILETASAEELFTLASAARYRQRTSLARDALTALRRRFPQSARALDATFLLGRVAESRGETNAALSWYDDYLSRAPKGTYGAEALGRKMTMLRRSFGTARARPVAEEYLRRHPKGSYAGSARVLLTNP